MASIVYTIIMSKTLLFKNIANISTGYPFRAALNKLSGNDIKVISAKNITENTVINFNNLTAVRDIGFKEKFYVCFNDIILTARGYFKAGVVDEVIENTIASASVYIIRLTDKNILPKYLAIYFNSAIGQKKLSERATGAAITTILKSDLENIDINIPNLEKQKQIIEVYENNQAMQKLLKQKAFLTNKISQGLINKSLTA